MKKDINKVPFFARREPGRVVKTDELANVVGGERVRKDPGLAEEQRKKEG